MAQLLIDSDFQADYSDDEIEFANDDILNYRGYFQGEMEEDEGPKFYEHGAHFPYFYLYQKLQILLQAQQEKENKKTKTTKSNSVAKVGICFHNNQLSRNRRNNLTDQFLNSEFQKKEIYNDNESSRNQNTSSIIQKQKLCESVCDNKNHSKEIINCYTTFASKLKMNRHLKLNKKSICEDDKEKPKNKNKTVNLSSDKMTNSISKQKKKNHCISFKNEKLNSRSKSKELSGSYYRNHANKKIAHLNNKEQNKKNQSKLIANSINNLLISYKNKRKANGNSGLHPQPTKITQTFSPHKKKSKTKAIKSNSRNNSHFGSINMNIARESSSNSKKRTINDKGNSKIKDILSSIMQISSRKSRNAKEGNNKLSPTRSNKKENPHLTQQNERKNQIDFILEHKISNKTECNPSYFNEKKRNKEILNKNNLSKENHNKTLDKVICSRNSNQNNKPSKTSFTLKIDFHHKNNDNNILNEFKKNILYSNLLNKTNENTKKMQKNINLQNVNGQKQNIQHQYNKIIKYNKQLTRNSVNGQNSNANAKISSLQIINSKNKSNSININININNTNKIFYSNVINECSKRHVSKNKGIFYLYNILDNKKKIISPTSLSQSNYDNALMSPGNNKELIDNNNKICKNKQKSISISSQWKSKHKVYNIKTKKTKVNVQKIN